MRYTVYVTWLIKEREMKNWKVKIEFVGLMGVYVTETVIKAKTEKSATRKAYAIIGDRSYNSIEIKGA